MNHLRKTRPAAFTTIELLVVIGIIVLLIGILIPVVGKVRDSARATDTAAWVQQLGGAIEAYHTDFKAYPGPLPNDAIRATNAGDIQMGFTPTWPTEYAMHSGPTNDGNQRVTMAENLVLGLLGGLKLEGNPPLVVYDPQLVGGGPMSLNPGQPKRYSPYLENKQLSWQTKDGKKTGAFFDEATEHTGGADDSIIPEFVDRYSDPLPILVLRAKVGANGVPGQDPNGKNSNPVITNNAGSGATYRAGQYDISQIMGYTNPMPAIGVGRRMPVYYENGSVQNAPPLIHGLTHEISGATTMGPAGVSGYNYPYNAFPYFRDPSLSNPRVQGSSGYEAPHVARQKDRFILIAAGPDRIYGTNDDITNFGSVAK